MFDIFVIQFNFCTSTLKLCQHAIAPWETFEVSGPWLLEPSGMQETNTPLREYLSIRREYFNLPYLFYKSSNKWHLAAGVLRIKYSSITYKPQATGLQKFKLLAVFLDPRNLMPNIPFVILYFINKFLSHHSNIYIYILGTNNPSKLRFLCLKLLAILVDTCNINNYSKAKPSGL